MRAFGDFARLDFVQGVYPLPTSIDGVHEMHAMRRNFSDLIERFARGLTLVNTARGEWLEYRVCLVYGVTGEKFKSRRNSSSGAEG